VRLTERSKVNNLNRKKIMLWTIFVILLILWLLGFIGFHVLGAYIHILLVIALVVLILQLIGGRRSL
jgi:asparagine N-glycosylation enzyme membrane subunit Stt3